MPRKHFLCCLHRFHLRVQASLCTADSSFPLFSTDKQLMCHIVVILTKLHYRL